MTANKKFTVADTLHFQLFAKDYRSSYISEKGKANRAGKKDGSRNALS